MKEIGSKNVHNLFSVLERKKYIFERGVGGRGPLSRWFFQRKRNGCVLVWISLTREKEGEREREEEGGKHIS